MGSSYEDNRQKRVEENNKRLHELNLVQLSRSLSISSSKDKDGNRRRKNKTLEDRFVMIGVSPMRRSPRVAAKPAPVYFPDTAKMNACYKSYGRAINLSFSDAIKEKRAETIMEAEKLELNLKEEGFPTVIRPIIPSNISCAPSVVLPKYFCRSSLPANDGMMTLVTLVNEEGEKFPAAYVPGRNLLRSGWKQFAQAHELVDGDAVIFQVIEPSVLKVHIVRLSSL